MAILKRFSTNMWQSITSIQQELENTTRELETTKGSVLEKDRIIKQRDGLLETHGLESRRLSELLDKERQAHRNTKNQFETFQRTHQHVSRTVTSQDSRIVELETTRASDKKRISQLEATYKEQIAERNNLLLLLWSRLSALCGQDWAHDNSLINGRALPSLESISTMLPGFSKNLLAAVKTIEAVLGAFHGRVKSVERELWREYQVLENNLESRNKKLERLETLVRAGVASGNLDAHTRLTHLETKYHALQIENATLQRARDARMRNASYNNNNAVDRTPTKSGNDSREELNDKGNSSPSPLVPTGPYAARDSRLPRSKATQHLETMTSTRSGTSSMTRVPSQSGTTEDLSEQHQQQRDGGGGPAKGGAGGVGGMDEKVFMLRLREMEKKLKDERDARLADRAEAARRLRDSDRQMNELNNELVRAQRRAGGGELGL